MIKAPLKLPPIHLLVALVLAAPAILLADLKNWFYQIPIPREWWPWFCTRIAACRGDFVQVALTVLSMGLGISTYIAHSLALAVARLAMPTAPSSAGSWVDNLFWVGTTAELDVVQENLSRLQHGLNFIWSSPPTVHTSSFDFLGLTFDLRAGLASIGPDLKRKLLESQSLTPTGLTLRSALSAIGCAIYANWVIGRYPLAFFNNLLSWLSASLSSIDQLDLDVHLPPAALSELVELSQRSALASLSRADLDRHTAPRINLFSDASDGALGAVYVSGSPSSRVWKCDRSLSIFAKEALATLLSTTLIPRGVTDSACAIDNQGWLWALLKGHSRSPFVNRVLRVLFTMIDERRLNFGAAFVPTHLQLADFPSRFKPLPSDWPRYLAAAPTPTPLPFFRIPCREEGPGALLLHNISNDCAAHRVVSSCPSDGTDNAQHLADQATGDVGPQRCAESPPCSMGHELRKQRQTLS
jgi:hypothetical protein